MQRLRGLAGPIRKGLQKTLFASPSLGAPRPMYRAPGGRKPSGGTIIRRASKKPPAQQRTQVEVVGCRAGQAICVALAPPLPQQGRRGGT